MLFNCAFAQTQKQLDSLERLIPKKTGKDKVLLLNDLTFYYYQTDTDKAIKFGEQSLELAKKINDKKLLANTYNDFSMPFITNGKNQKAIELNFKALEIRKQIKDSVGIMSSYIKLGTAYFELAKYAESQRFYNKAITYAKALNDEVNLLKIYQNSANVLEANGSTEQALVLHKDIQVLAKKLGEDGILIVSLGNTGSVYRKLKMYPESRKAYEEAEILIKKSGDEEQLALVYQGLGVLESDQKNKKEALQYYLKAYKIYENIGSGYSTAVVAGNIGNVYSSLGEFEKAEAYLKESLDELVTSRSYRQIANAYGNLAANEVKRGDYKNSVRYFELQIKYRDSVVLFQGSENQAEMFAKYQLEKKEREIAEHKAQIAEANFASLMLTSVLVLLALLFILAFLYFRGKRKQARKELLLTKKEEKLLREKQLSEQKLEISRELHDNIGSQITYMISSMDNLTYVTPENDPVNSSIKNISEFGRETMNDLRSTIWAMNSQDGTLETLIHKLEDLRTRIPVQIEIHAAVDGNFELKATEMLNVFRIVQEALQNSLKYADATKVEIFIDKSEDKLRFRITDNGKGFDLENTSSGNGLLNMKHRSSQMNASFEIVSEIGKGTTITCILGQMSY
jgi:signal transduction histidine kinase